MIEKYKSHDGHNNQKCDPGEKHPFYQPGKIRFPFHQKNLRD
jgi:hypothetical protein